MTLCAAIADDDRLSRQQVSRLLSEEPGFRVTQELATGWEAVHAVREERPDVLFLDIQMPDLDGFGVLRELGAEGAPEVVFVTAYGQYALKAFEAGAADYLLKPLDPRRFHETLEKVRRRVEGSSRPSPESPPSAGARRAENQRRPANRLAVPSGDRILFLPTDGILSVEAAGNYVRVHAASGSYLRRDTLAGVSQLLDADRFLRVHRCWLVNVDKIRELVPWFHRTFILFMENGQRIQVSRSFRDPIRALLGGRRRQARKAPPR